MDCGTNFSLKFPGRLYIPVPDCLFCIFLLPFCLNHAHLGLVLMIQQAAKGMWIHTGGYGHFSCEYVKVKFKSHKRLNFLRVFPTAHQYCIYNRNDLINIQFNFPQSWKLPGKLIAYQRHHQVAPV